MSEKYTYFLVDKSNFPPGWSMKQVHQAANAVKKGVGKQNSRNESYNTQLRGAGVVEYDEEGEVVDAPVISICRSTLSKSEITLELVATPIAIELGFSVEIVMNKLLVFVFDSFLALKEYIREHAVKFGEVIT